MRPPELSDADALAFVAEWNRLVAMDDQPKPPAKGQPRGIWFADTPAGRRAKRRARQGFAPPPTPRIVRDKQTKLDLDHQDTVPDAPVQSRAGNVPE